ncbi:uncharacterized protein LOC133834775 [Humulus lupulus]|uniref:uncharacterized protein LOC133834775 n=1 Tax=Humulus lupulus TaxID=3486 RepID=UPI002B404C6E|nr:uncharacterized protein LOC133834775 [Humulus lupulus]
MNKFFVRHTLSGEISTSENIESHELIVIDSTTKGSDHYMEDSESDPSIEDAKSSERSAEDGCLTEDADIGGLPKGVPLNPVTLSKNQDYITKDIGATHVGMPGEKSDMIGYVFGLLGDGWDKCQVECVSQPTGFLNINPICTLTRSDIEKWRIDYSIPSSIEMRLSRSYERADWEMGDWVCLYEIAFAIGFRFPFSPIVTKILEF